MKPFYFKITDWKLTWNFRELQDWNYKAEKVTQKANHNQFRLYRGWHLKHLVKFHEELGEVKTTEWLHKELWEFRTQRIYNDVWNKKRWITKIISTSTFSKKQMSDYIKKIENYYIDNYWYAIPLPLNEQELLQWERMLV